MSLTTKFIDIHTHRSYQDHQHLSIYNLNCQDDPLDDQLYSVSVHPWSLKRKSENERKWEHLEFRLDFHLAKSRCVALGEIGLDKKHSHSWDLQLHFFKKLAHYACSRQVPILILHSVKGHHECLNLLANFKGTVIFHDYYGSWQETQALLRRNHTYLSLGSILDRPQSKLYQDLSKLPLERLFLETDDSKKSIEERYEDFCRLTQHDTLVVKRQLDYNLKTIGITT